MLPLPRTVRIKLGRRCYAKPNRKINPVEVEITYGYTDQGLLRFSAKGYVWNFTHTKWIASGQCLDSIYERCVGLRHNKLFMDVYGLWKRNHLNDCSKYVNREQKELVEKFNETEHHTFEEEVEYLKRIGKYSYVVDDQVCEYAQKWYYQEISPEDQELIEQLISIGEEEEFDN